MRVKLLVSLGIGSTVTRLDLTGKLNNIFLIKKQWQYNDLYQHSVISADQPSSEKLHPIANENREAEN